MEDFKKDMQNNGFLSTVLNFDKMITPVIIKIIFIISLIVCTLIGLGLIISGMDSYYGGGLQVFIGLMTLIIGPIIIRVYCELLIVIFKIHESLTVIKNK